MTISEDGNFDFRLPSSGVPTVECKPWVRLSAVSDFRWLEGRPEPKAGSQDKFTR